MLKTFFAAITAEGRKFPLILVAKGKTARCHGQLGQHDQFEREIWHSPSGWCTVPLIQQYLRWLRARIPGEPICLIMDQFTVHITNRVTETAEKLGIEIIWVPKGATSKYQPRDRCAFGALKSKGRGKRKFIFSQECGKQCNKEIAAELLLQSLAELSDSAVETGWDFNEPAAEDDKSKSASSHDEFVFETGTESSDEELDEQGE
jgi:hypothetical protein